MNIMVIDVPAESGGALSVLNDFYKEVVEHDSKDINWIFVLSTPALKETKKIKILNFPWIKKSWGHRFYFDQVIAPKLVKEYRIDKVFSLQNVVIPRVVCEQVLYVHQSLPFVDYKFSFKENKLFWVYQKIIGKNIIKSIKKAEKVIVQTEWMKKACIEKTQIQASKIEVIPPIINVEIERYFESSEKSLSTFFYPASGLLYKNHQLILNACRDLKSRTNKHFEIILTLTGNENPYVEDLYRQVQREHLPISFEGPKTRREVFELYTQSILIFPSYIETFGLPILEVRLHKGIIFAANTSFAKEILKGYENAKFFEVFDSKELSILMYKILNNKEVYRKSPDIQENQIEIKKQLIDFLVED
ncbi:glycosyltransferase [Psychrobacillus sp. FJAT-21963]|uniref:glycosyltransferase n=1 Tax=Psychrobacillus sp. FJAT-21963 TaxID=1712028 RepID=UPI0006F1C39B|nr:glycosyltransferase [Psychrobacillus sp. FJAT-21963]KQL36905.1 glycosyl transferase family 1 [Psychrobacillus sp. FJAT-21963]